MRGKEHSPRRRGIVASVAVTTKILKSYMNHGVSLADTYSPTIKNYANLRKAFSRELTDDRTRNVSPFL